MDNYAYFSVGYVHYRITVTLFASCECNKQNKTLHESLTVMWGFLRQEGKKYEGILFVD